MHLFFETINFFISDLLQHFSKKQFAYFGVLSWNTIVKNQLISGFIYLKIAGAFQTQLLESAKEFAPPRPYLGFFKGLGKNVSAPWIPEEAIWDLWGPLSPMVGSSEAKPQVGSTGNILCALASNDALTFFPILLKRHLSKISG